MRGLVYHNNELAGYLEKDARGHYTFSYEEGYFTDDSKPPVSLSLPKSKREYHSPTLFSFFFGLLSEGINKNIQCRSYKIDRNDYFTRLLRTAGNDTIGAITIKPENDEMFRML